MLFFKIMLYLNNKSEVIFNKTDLVVRQDFYIISIAVIFYRNEKNKHIVKTAEN